MVSKQVEPRILASPDIRNYTPRQNVSGRLEMVGSELMLRMAQEWADEFQTYHPDAILTYANIPPRNCRGYVTLLGPDAGLLREGFTNDAFTQEFGYEPLMVTCSFGTYFDHGMGIWVHEENPLGRLSLQELDAIYSTTRRRGANDAIRTWGDLGLTGEWLEREITPYGRGADSQVSWWIRDVVLLGGDVRPEVRVPGDGKSASVRDAMASDPSGICYLSFGEAPKAPNLKVLSLAQSPGGRYVEPSPESIAGDIYPLIRYYQLGINMPPSRALDDLTREFLDYVLSRQGQAAVSRAQCIPMSPEAVRSVRITTGVDRTANLETTS